MPALIGSNPLVMAWADGSVTRGRSHVDAYVPVDGSPFQFVRASSDEPAPSFLRITEPFSAAEGHFLPLADLIADLGLPAVQHLAIESSNVICETFTGRQLGGEEALRRRVLSDPSVINSLYIPAPMLYDSPVFQRVMAHCGYDAFMWEDAFGERVVRVFSEDQVLRPGDAPAPTTPASEDEQVVWPVGFCFEVLQQAFDVRDSLSYRESFGGLSHLSALDSIRSVKRNLEIAVLARREQAVEWFDERNRQQVLFQLFGSGKALLATVSQDQKAGDFHELFDYAPLAFHALARAVAPRPSGARIGMARVAEQKPMRIQATPGMGWLTVDQAEEEVRALGLGELLDRDLLKVVRLGNELPGDMPGKHDISGLAYDGVMYLNASRLQDRWGVSSTLFHESMHAQVPGLLGDRGWGALMDRLAIMYDWAVATGRADNSHWEAALKDVEKAHDIHALSYAERVEEFGAYALSASIDMPSPLIRWAQSAVGFAKAWVLRRFEVQLGDVSPQQLHHLSRMALHASVCRDDFPKASATARFEYAMRSAKQAPSPDHPVMLYVTEHFSASKGLPAEAKATVLSTSKAAMERFARVYDEDSPVYCVEGPRESLLINGNSTLEDQPEPVRQVFKAMADAPESLPDGLRSVFAERGLAIHANLVLHKFSEELGGDDAAFQFFAARGIAGLVRFDHQTTSEQVTVFNAVDLRVISRYEVPPEPRAEAQLELAP